MRTQFNPASLANPDMAQSEKILRACVHCGFCNATCPTYLLSGDENDGPRGRIYLMREMLQSTAAPDARTVAHIDGCLSCLGCATTCPSGVDYMRLVDHARAHIETHYRRPVFERLLRAALNIILPHPARFRAALCLGRMSAPFAKLLPAALARMAVMAKQIPGVALPSPQPSPPRGEGEETKKLRVILLDGCVQPALAPQTNAATIRLLTRLGVEMVIPENVGCCGALTHHLGKTEGAKQFARANIRAWMKGANSGGLDAILMTASGCGSQVKDYVHMLRDDNPYAEDAAHISGITQDISEFLCSLDWPADLSATDMPPLRVAYHAPCSLRHGQKINGKVESLLQKAGFEVLLPADAHLCCGAAGSYTLLQPEMSERLAARKGATLQALKADIIVSANVGCQIQLTQACATPVLHWVELLDWACGGPMPEQISALSAGA